MSSIFVSVPKVTAIVNQGVLNRQGLIADKLFPLLRTACNFSLIDWNKAKDLKVVNDILSCKTTINEVDASAFDLQHHKTQDRGLSITLTECCVGLCDDGTISDKIEAAKMTGLMDRLLIAHERRAIALACLESAYTDNTTKVPGETGAVNEGGLYKLAATKLVDADFDLLGWFQPIQQKNFMTGMRNVAIMTSNVLNKLLKHPSFVGFGYAPNPQTTTTQVASLLKVQEIIIADAGFNNTVVEGAVNMQGLWDDQYILFAMVYPLAYSEDSKVTFGVSAYTTNFQTTYFLDPKKGKGKGVVTGKLDHDITPTVVTYKAATLIKLT